MKPRKSRINDAPVLAEGRVAFDAVQAYPNLELPGGISFTIIQFSGTIDEWLVLEQKAAPAQNPIDANTIRKTSVAGHPALVYQYNVTGTSGAAGNYIVALDAEKLLLIASDSVIGETHGSVIDGLVITEPATQAAPTVTAIMPTVSAQLAPRWRTVAWQGLVIPVPPGFQWKALATMPEPINGGPVLAAGWNAYVPPADGQVYVELPTGPGFTILRFAGSLEAWLKLERRSYVGIAVTPLQEDAIQNMTIAGRPAKAYPAISRGVTGTAGYYILKLDDTRLLRISTDDTSNETYRRVIDGLAIKQQ